MRIVLATGQLESTLRQFLDALHPIYRRSVGNALVVASGQLPPIGWMPLGDGSANEERQLARVSPSSVHVFSSTRSSKVVFSSGPAPSGGTRRAIP